jgi:hypothetical protein
MLTDAKNGYSLVDTAFYILHSVSVLNCTCFFFVGRICSRSLVLSMYMAFTFKFSAIDAEHYLKQPVVFRATGLRQVTSRFFITFYTYTIKCNGKLRHQVSVLEQKFKKAKADRSKSCDIIYRSVLVFTVIMLFHFCRTHRFTRNS